MHSSILTPLRDDKKSSHNEPFLSFCFVGKSAEAVTHAKQEMGQKRICTEQAPHKVGASKDVAKPNGIHGVNIKKKTCFRNWTCLASVALRV